MTNPTGIRQGAGLRFLQVMALDANGYPAASGTTAYTGIIIQGAKNLTINDPEPRQVVHFGDDQVEQLQTLPPTEPITGELQVSKVNDVVDAVLTQAKQVTVGETQLMAIGHNKKGYENRVALLAYQASNEADEASENFGAPQWDFRLLPSCYVIPREGTLDENPTTRPYTVRPQFVSKHLWGVAFTTGTEGVTKAQGFRGVANGQPTVAAFKGNNTATQFALPADMPATSTTVMQVWKEGVLQTSGVATLTTSQITFTTAPTTGARIVVFYER
jgi:hypothetical protein